MVVRERMIIRGIVQGVGFRPFIYRLATEHDLTGWVLNDHSGVKVEAEGEMEEVDSFKKRVADESPPLAMIVSFSSVRIAPLADGRFEIRLSEKNQPAATLISPDIAICGDCLAELRDRDDRRYRYPFINCTNCGPRYTIIEDIPYDRPRTSMKHFVMCPSCEAEYNDPGNRRFHAQPNACPECGPRLILYEEDGRKAGEGIDPLEEAIDRLERGQIGAIKGLGGFHLAVRADDQEAVCRLRERKNREEKAMAIMVPGLDEARSLVYMSTDEEKELISPRRPIILAKKKKEIPVAEAVAPSNNYLGIMMPYTPLHYLLFSEGSFKSLVMTSANLSEEPICIENEEALRRLRGIADFYLAHNRLIYLRSDDSVIRVFRGHPYPIRRSRGYVPAPVILSKKMHSVMALGGELKNTVCLTKGSLAFLSQHVGDMENEATLRFFEKTVEHIEKILECRAEVLAHDLHPDYFSTRYAEEQKERPIVAVQHHHAHAVACMAEHGLEGEVLAVTFDGTGHGEDGHIWGGEFLVTQRGAYRRVAHLKDILMPGGDAAIKEPYRMALSCLHALYGDDLSSKAPQFLGRHRQRDIDVLLQMMDKGINTYPTSSAGRLFDAVSSLLGIRDKVSFEGQAAMELEQRADPDENVGHYQFSMDSVGETVVINTLPIIEAVWEEWQKGVGGRTIATRFHQTMAEMITRVLDLLRGKEGLDRVVLSGGVFQNINLLNRLVRRLEDVHFQVFWHQKVPTNDGGLSLGQALAAHEIYYGGG